MVRRDLDEVDERGGEEGEEEVEEEARVGLEAQDAGADTEERGADVVQGREGLSSSCQYALLGSVGNGEGERERERR